MSKRAISGSFIPSFPASFRRLPGVLVALCLTGFVALAGWVLPQAEAGASSCEIVETARVGNRGNPRSRTFNNMSEITSVVVQSLTNRWSDCGAGQYSFVDNVLSTQAGCRAWFEVTGIEAGCTPPVPTTGPVAQAPLYLTVSVDPNILFVLDDSGSMQWELIPDDMIYSYFVYPRSAGVYGGSDYFSWVPTFEAGYSYSAWARSPQTNVTYYNPGITYEPWILANGTELPDATPTAALHNPMLPNIGSRNLTTNNTQSSGWDRCNQQPPTGCTFGTWTQTFYPAVYFWHDGGSEWDYTNYTQVEIQNTTPLYTGHGRENRNECVDGECTYAQEIQNFANWYTYYRSRILAARGGIGAAFSQLGSSARVGFGAINTTSTGVDGISSGAILAGVRPFIGTERNEFFDQLYGLTISTSGTPLRRALNHAGQYYSSSDNRGPWGATPGTDDSTPHLECRRSYSILMTDGFWNGPDPSNIGNEDGTDGPTITGPGGQSHSYVAQAPFSDNRSETLADVAMHYWKNDVRSDIANRLVPVDTNPAFWQHMTTIGVGLGVTGSAEPDDAFAAIDTGAHVEWGDPFTTNAGKTDDLLHASVNSRGRFFSAAEPQAFAAQLAETLQAVIGEARSSAASVAANSTRLDTETLIYQARFDSGDWSGEIVAYQVNLDGSLGDVAWTTSDAGSIPVHSSRNILTWNGTTGLAFTVANWNDFYADQRSALRAGGTVDMGQKRLSWLRGSSADEGSLFRERTARLGDIIYSNPYFVGKQNYGFRALPGTEGSGYEAFRASAAYQQRPGMVYVGANDGMLHGFDAATGLERMAFIPRNVFPHIAELTDPNYQHRYFVDGSPRATDAYVDLGGGAEWRTILVGSTGAGGRSVFAIDVTDPSAIGPNQVLWEIEAGELGYAIGQPTIARLASGHWVAVFGNGYDNPSNQAKLVIADLATGAILKTISTDAGDAASRNGLSEVVPVSLNRDGITDYVYAGDLLGNLWKFDLQGNTVNQWDVAFKQGSQPRPLFQARDPDGVAQPITARPLVVEDPAGGQMVLFGTGQFFREGDQFVDANTQIQSFYGVRDTGTRITDDRDVALVEQQIILEELLQFTRPDGTVLERAVRATTNHAVGSEEGWYIDLIHDGNVEGERSVTRAVFRNGYVVFATLIPDADPCGTGGKSWLMELRAFDGARPNEPVLDLNEDAEFDSADTVTFVDENGDTITIPVSGLRPPGEVGIFGTPTVIGAGRLDHKYLSTSQGEIERVSELGAGETVRGSWRQLQ